MKNSVKKLATILTMALLLTSLSGCALPFGLGKPKATPTPMPTPMNAQPRATHTPTPKPTATFTPAPTNTPTPTNTSTPTPTPTNTPTPTDTPTPTPTPCTHIWEFGYDIEVKEVCPLCGREYVSSVTRLYYCTLCDADKEEELPVTPHVCPTATPTPTATNTPKPTATPTYPPYGTPNEWFTQEDLNAESKITYKCYSVPTDYEKGAFFYGADEAMVANWLEHHEDSWNPQNSGIIVEGYIKADIAGTSSDMWPAYYTNDLADVEGGISDGPLCYIRGGQKGTRVMGLYYRHVYRKKSQQITTAGGLYGIWMTMPDYFDESSDTYTEFMFDLKNPNTRITYVTKDKKTGKVLDTKNYDTTDSFEPQFHADNQYINIKYLENMVVLDHDPTKE